MESDTLCVMDTLSSLSRLIQAASTRTTTRRSRLAGAASGRARRLPHPARRSRPALLQPHDVPLPIGRGAARGAHHPFAGGDIYGRWRRSWATPSSSRWGSMRSASTPKLRDEDRRAPRGRQRRAVQNFRENQLSRIGSMFDWSHQVNTADPSYYRWTQWLFVRLFTRARRVARGSGQLVPSCLTVLADEQVEQGRCERCHTVVQTRYLRQWWIKITRYAQQMLDALDTLDWSESTKTMQRNWIGRSEERPSCSTSRLPAQGRHRVHHASGHAFRCTFLVSAQTIRSWRTSCRRSAWARSTPGGTSSRQRRPSRTSPSGWSSGHTRSTR